MIWLFLLNILALILLIVGCYHDWRTGNVSNKITLAVTLVLLPVIYFNIPNITLNHILAFFTVLWMGLWGLVGGADMKVFLPLTFSLNLIHVVSFLVLFSIFGFSYIMITKQKNDVPAFIPITLAYFGVMFLA